MAARFMLLTLFCLASLIGCAAPGDESNYKELEDPPEKTTDPSVGNQRQSMPTQDQTPVMKDEDTSMPDPFVRATDQKPVASPSDSTQPLSERVKAVYGTTYGPDVIDRTEWPTVEFSPADGRTVHNPTYYSDVDLGDDDIDVTSSDYSVEERMGLALEGAKPGFYDAQNSLDLVWQPVLFAGETLIIPVMVFIEPPLENVTTPDISSDEYKAE